MKLKYLFLNLFIASQLCATSEPAFPKLPQNLEKQYTAMLRTLRFAKIDPRLRKEVEDLIIHLREAGGEPQALTLEHYIGILGMAGKKPAPEEKEQAATVVRPVTPEKPAVPQQPLAPEQPAAAAPKPAITAIPVRVSGLIRGKPEEIVLTEDEPLTTESYGELLDRQKEHNDPMILVRVVTRERAGGPLFVHYYDAYTYNTMRFGPNYPLSGPLVIKETNNPLNRMPIEGKVQYFIYEPKNPEAGFQYAFSEADFITDPETRLIVDRYQNMDATRKKEAEERAAGEFVPAPKPYVQEVLLPQQPMIPEPQPHPQPMPVESMEAAMIRAANSLETDPLTRAGVQVSLGLIFERRHDYAQALDYFGRAANQTVNQNARAIANGWLGELFLHGYGVVKNTATALQYLTEAANQTVNPKIQAEAEWRLGEIAYEGINLLGARMPPNYVIAKKHFEKALNQTASPQARANAQFYLGMMYAQGNGVQKDIPRAIEYLSAASRNLRSLINKAKAQKMVSELLAEQEETALQIGLAASRAHAEQEEKQKAAQRAREEKEKKKQQ